MGVSSEGVRSEGGKLQRGLEEAVTAVAGCCFFQAILFISN